MVRDRVVRLVYWFKIWKVFLEGFWDLLIFMVLVVELVMIDCSVVGVVFFWGLVGFWGFDVIVMMWWYCGLVWLLCKLVFMCWNKFVVWNVIFDWEVCVGVVV